MPDKVNRSTRKQRGLAQPGSGTPKFAFPFIANVVANVVEFQLWEVAEGRIQPALTPLLQELKFNPGVLPNEPEGQVTQIVGLSVDNAGAGGTARILVELDQPPLPGEQIVFPANWATVRSISGHWISASIWTNP